MKCLLLAFLTLSLPVAAQLQTPVRVVRASPPGEFTSLHAAVAAADAGDVLLVSPGTYPQTSDLVIDRPMSIVVDGGTALLRCEVTVTGIPAGASVHLRGLEIESLSGLRILASPGHVWVEDCTVTPYFEWTFSSRATAIEVEDCADVVLVDTRGYGLDLVLFDEPIGHGLSVVDSTVHAYDCHFEGGYAFDIGTTTQAAGHGVFLGDAPAELLLSGCTAIGGDGECSCPSGNGRNGAGLFNAGGTAYVVGSTLTAGAYVPGFFCVCGEYPDTWGNHTAFPGSPVLVSGGPPAREGQPHTLAFDGPPLVPVWYGASLSAQGQWMPSFRGSSLLGPLLAARFAGTLDANGHLDVTLNVPPIVAASSGIRLFVQAFSGGPAILGGGTIVLLLDQSL